jgi:hypothetical protein
LCRSGVFVDINFDDARLITHFGFEFFEDGFHHFAGSAPFGEKIDENGFVGLYEFLKGGHVTRIGV